MASQLLAQVNALIHFFYKKKITFAVLNSSAGLKQAYDDHQLFANIMKPKHIILEIFMPQFHCFVR